jgi:2-(1,2-epoxy-1,2-dihydrophenyl)acetyl-CoA isomerase
MIDVHPELRVELGADHVGTIILDRAPNNFIDVDLGVGIANAIAALEGEMGCRAIVLASNGKHFCAGANLSLNADDQPKGSVNPLYEQVARMAGGSVPIVAAVQGAAIGAGLGLALIADFRVASPQARFGATFARLGFHPGFGITATLPEIVGKQRALDMLYTGRRVTGDEAFSFGLCDRLVEGEGEAVRSAALDFAREIAGSAPLSLRAIRQTMRGDLVDRIRSATAVEHLAQQKISSSADYKEGLAASAARREPNFQGR